MPSQCSISVQVIQNILKMVSMVPHVYAQDTVDGITSDAKVSGLNNTGNAGKLPRIHGDMVASLLDAQSDARVMWIALRLMQRCQDKQYR